MTSLPRTHRALAAVALAGALLVGCGGDSDDDTETDDEAQLDDEATTTTEAEATTTTAAAEPTTTVAAGPQLVVTPAEGLTDGQVVQVSGSGFTPGKALTLAQCSEDNTGPGDCHTAGSAFVTVAADGTLAGELKIKVGPIGTNGKVCDAATPCSVGTADISDPTGPDLSRTRITFA